MAIPGETKPIRVASVTRNWVIGGDESRLLQTALAFDRSLIDQTVFVIDDPSRLSDDEQARWADMADQYRSIGVEVVNFGSGTDLRGLSDARETVSVIRRLAAELRRRTFDVVDGRMGLGGLVATPAARLARVPIVTLTSYYTNLYDGRLKRVLGQGCVANVNALISDAQATLDDFDAWRWGRRAELVHIPNGIRPVSSTLTTEEARAALGVPVDPTIPLVGQVSWMIPRKGWETFLRSARIVADRHPEVHFLGVGFVDDEHRSYFDDLLRMRHELCLDDTVTLTSYAGPVGDVHAAIDVFTHLSLDDSSPIAIHEAMSAGQPTVVSALPGNTELVSDGVTGLMVPVGDVAATATAVERLLTDRDLATAVGQAFADQFRENHSPEAMARAHEALYRRLLGPAGGTDAPRAGTEDGRVPA